MNMLVTKILTTKPIQFNLTIIHGYIWSKITQKTTKNYDRNLSGNLTTGHGFQDPMCKCVPF